MAKGRLFVLFVALATAWGPLGSLAGEEPGRERLFIIGQDLDSLRDYYASECCPQADGATGYLDFYNLANPEAGFGGLGMDLEGQPLEQEMDWGGGGANLWKTARDFPGGIAIGLNISENDHSGGLDRLVAGEHDDSTRQLARFIKLAGVPVWLRIGYEFDGGWNSGYEDAERYKAAWRRIVDVLREEGVENVEFVWQAAAFPLDILTDGGYTDVRQWYPGDDYVDWLGVSMFMHLDEKPAVEVAFEPPTSRELLGGMLDLAREVGKPVFIGEASPQGYDLARGTNANIAATWDGPQAEGLIEVSSEQIWERWYAPLFEWMEENRDLVYALSYINCHWDSQDLWNAPYESGYWGDTRLQASPYLARRFSEAVERWRTLD